MFALSDSNANRAYGTVRGFQLRACKAARSADACSSVSLQVWMVSGFIARKINRKGTQRTQKFLHVWEIVLPSPLPSPIRWARENRFPSPDKSSYGIGRTVEPQN